MALGRVYVSLTGDVKAWIRSDSLITETTVLDGSLSVINVTGEADALAVPNLYSSCLAL